MSRKAIRDLIGGAFLVATAVVYFLTAAEQRPVESAPAPPVAVETIDSPAGEAIDSPAGGRV